MIDLNNLKVYKGAPITIITALMLLKRNASQKELQEICGYGSDRPVRDALAVLIQDHIVIKAGHGSYMLAAYQLPLSWTETIERLPSEELSYVQSTGDIAESTSLQERIEDHESRIRKLEAILNVRTKYEAIAESAGTSVQSTTLLPEKAIVQSTETIAESTGIIVQSTTSDEAGVKGLINKEPVKEASKQVIDIDPCLVKDKEDKQLTGSAAETAESTIPNTAKKAWTTAMGQMKCCMDRQTYETLLGSAVLIGYDNGLFTIGFPNSFTRDWAEKRLTETIGKMLGGMMTVPVSLSFVEENNPTKKSEVKKFEMPKPEQLPVPDKLRYTGEEKCIAVVNEYLKEPTGIAYSVKEMQDLITPRERGAVVDPDVLRFILPRAANFSAAKRYAGQRKEALKYNLMSRVFGLKGPYVNRIVNDPEATPELIDFHYWSIDQDPEHDVAKDSGLVLSKILEHENKLHAETCDPLQTEYIE